MFRVKIKLGFQLVLSVCFAFEIYAQSHNVKVYSVNEGLPSGQIYDVAFTKDGYAWFASGYGLIKSDGKNLTTFDKDHGLHDEIINDLHVDSKNIFWVATGDKGVGIFDKNTISYPSYLDSLDNKIVDVISESKDGKLWFGTQEAGIFILDPVTKEMRLFNLNNSLKSKTVWDILFDKDGNQWIGTHNGVQVFSKEGKELFSLSEETGLNGYAVFDLFEDSQGRVWLSSSNGVTVVSKDYSVQSISRLNGEELDFVYTVTEDEKGRIWIGTERNGIFVYKEGFQEHITKKNGLSSNFVYRFIKDDQNNIWVATNGDGVTIFKDLRFTFFDRDSEYGSNEVWGALKDSKGNLWFSNEGGLVRYRNEVFTRFEFPSGYEKEEFWDIEEQKNGNLLLISHDSRILEFNGTSFRNHELTDLARSAYSTDLLIDEEEIYLSGLGSIYRYRRGRIDTLQLDGDYWGAYANTLYKDRDQYLWVGTEDGIVQYKNGNQLRFNKENGVIGASVYVIKEDELGNLWLGTNKGISILTKHANGDSISARSYEIDDRFLAETMFIQFDGRGGIWQGTNAGVNYYNMHSWTDSVLVKNIHFPLKEYGKGLEFNGNTSLIDDEGNLWFGTARKGIVKVDLSAKLPIEKEAPEVFIREVVVNKEVAKELNDLTYDRNSIEILFSALDFENPNRIHYKYILEGLEDDYNFEYDINKAYYTNLDPGKYAFQVFAKSPNSDWTRTPTILQFSIDKPFWLKWWFYLIIVLVIASVLFIVFKARVVRLEKQELAILVDEKTKNLQRSLEEKEVLIKEIHHRVKNNLAVVSGLLEMQIWDLNDGEAKSALEESMLRVMTMSKIHENLYQNKDLAKIDTAIFLNELIDSITETMDSNEKKIEVIKEIESCLLNVNNGIPLGLITNELLTNSYKHAFKHSESGIIKVTFTDNKDSFYLSVYDDGAGAPEDLLIGKKTSLGITLIQSLTTQLNAALTYTNDMGSLFELKIPKKSD